ncbi:hypothetical protein MBN61_00895, partial [Candidatus Saccharibacteria bacterium]|nr:hypothetical protein [Candidatus Saccharibacteria bacterium]
EHALLASRRAFSYCKKGMFLNGGRRLLDSSLASLRNEKAVIVEISLQFPHTHSPFFLLLSAVL